MQSIGRPIAIFAALLLWGTAALWGQTISDSESITIQGQGTVKTRTFMVKDGWQVQVTADSPVKVSSVAVDGGANTLINFPAAIPAPPFYNGSSAPIPKGGIFTLSVETTGKWQVSIIESGFVKDMAIGGSPAPAATPPAATPAPSAAPTTALAPAAAPPMPTSTVMGTSYQMTRIAEFNRTSDFASSVEEDTADFTATNGWRLFWTTTHGVKITLVPANGLAQVLVDDTSTRSSATHGGYNSGGYHPYNNTIPNGGMNPIVNTDPSATTVYHGMCMGPTFGTFHFKVEGPGQWTLTVVSMMPSPISPMAGGPSSPVPGAAAASPSAAPATSAPIVKLTDDQARAVVLIKGDNAEGTGFMIKTPDGPAVITNIHVIANNPNFKITTNTGALVNVLSEKGASDRDLAMLMIKDAGYNYLDFSTDISQSVQPGDEVITPGNSQGGEVMLNTGGKVLGIGPVRIEIDNPIYHGNSGGPVFHPKSGKVLGVVTEGMKNEMTDDLDKASFASRNSAISGAMRYFGLRLDTVATWIPIDSRRFAVETTFLDQFHEQSRRLDAYLNRADKNQSNDQNNPNNSSGNDNREAKIYLDDAKIMKADDNYTSRISGSDTAQRIDLLKSLLFDLQCVADLDVDQIKDKSNFYSFDQERAQEEYDYRKALRDELDSIGSDIERLGNLPRTNN